MSGICIKDMFLYPQKEMASIKLIEMPLTISICDFGTEGSLLQRKRALEIPKMI